MLVELGNVIAGFKLGAPAIKKVVPPASKVVSNLEEVIEPWQTGLGWAVLVLGVITIIDRIGAPTYMHYFSSGYPQGILATASGLVILKDDLKKFPGLYHLAQTLAPMGQIIGILALLSALYRLI